MSRKYPPEVKERAIELRAEGATLRAIADKLGVSLATVRNWTAPGAAEQCKLYKSRNQEKISEWGKRYRAQNAERERERKKGAEYKARVNQQKRERYMRLKAESPEKYAAIRKCENEKRKDPIQRHRISERFRKKYNEDPIFRSHVLTRNRIRKSLKRRHAKSESSEKLLGCSFPELIERWNETYGDGWVEDSDLHIDHIRPCASFDLSDPAQRLVCFNWRNLQLLPAKENILKSDNWTPAMEEKWITRMRLLGYEGELFLRF